MMYEKCIKCGQLECSGAFTKDGFICAECELDEEQPNPTQGRPH